MLLSSDSLPASFDAILEAAQYVGLDAPSQEELKRYLLEGGHARTGLLARALRQVPEARVRRARLGIAEEITQRTLSDIALWARHFRRQTGILGLTEEILEWTQHYLRGDTVRLGAMQFDLIEFKSPVRIYRHRSTQKLVLMALTHGENTFEIDPATGHVLDHGRRFDPKEWKVALEPGMPIIEMHLPAESFVTFRSVTRSIRRAYDHFARLRPEMKPAGAFAEGWLHDPQLTEIIGNPELQKLQAKCKRYPASIPEAKTIRRIFGPDEARDSLSGLPRENLNSFQQRMADFLADPTRRLEARGLVILTEELEVIPEFSPKEM